MSRPEGDRMPDLFYENLEPGAVSTFGPRVVDRDEMVAFARAFDPQPFHLDETAAAATSVGRLIASGWFTAALQMRMLCDGWVLRAASRGGPGVEELRWLKPVSAGDALTLRQRILDRRVSASRPDIGIVRLSVELLRGGDPDDAVMRAAHPVMVGLRNPGRGPARPRETVAPLPCLDLPQPLGPPEDLAAAPRWYEEAEPGRIVDLGCHRFDATGIAAFARLYDPQPFHLDEAAAARGPFGTLAASGWHTAAAWMGRFAARLDRLAEAGGRPEVGVSPGFTDLRWLRPVLAGETIRFASETTAKRPLASRPGWGLVSSRNTGVNGRGETVFAFSGNAFWKMRRPG